MFKPPPAMVLAAPTLARLNLGGGTKEERGEVGDPGGWKGSEGGAGAVMGAETGVGAGAAFIASASPLSLARIRALASFSLLLDFLRLEEDEEEEEEEVPANADPSHPFAEVAGETEERDLTSVMELTVELVVERR